MQDKETLFARYPDLLDEQADAEMLALIGQLDAAYATPEPPAYLTLAGALEPEARLERQRRKPIIQWPRPVRWLPRRVSVVAVAVMLAVALMAAGIPLVAHFIDPDPGLTQVVKNPLLFQTVNASQTVDGFTLTVQKAYADANRIILSYTLIKVGDSSYNISYQPTLTTQDDIALRGREFLFTQTGVYTAFDADAITGSPQELHLRLTLDGSKVQTQQVDPAQRSPRLSQPISVDFSVQFHAGRVANLHQAVTVHGKTLILEKVVVTPSETRVYLRGDGYSLALYGIPTLTVGSWSSTQLSSEQHPGPALDVWPTDDQWPTNAMVAVNFDTSLMDRHGQWTLTIPQLGNPGPSTQGPWIFHFEVP